MRFPIKPHRSAKNNIQGSAAVPAVEQNIGGLAAAGFLEGLRFVIVLCKLLFLSAKDACLG